MATIDLGTFTDAAHDARTTTRVEVLDEGELPPLPDELAERISAEAVSFGDGYGLGPHRWVEVSLTREAYSGQSLLVLYAANRGEWVCLACDSYYSAYGYLYGDHSLSGPYRVSPALMDCVLRAHGAPPSAVAGADLERCHPDQCTRPADHVVDG